jgi:glycosyltransferase involved in cell wall biosynthesis
MQPTRVRLLKFIGSFRIGGTERQAVSLALRLNSARFEARLACFQRYGGLLKVVESGGMPIEEYNIDCLYNANTVRQQLRFAGYVWRNQIQVVHTYGFYTNIFAIPAARLAGAPVIVASVRDMGDIHSPLQRRAQKLICCLADCVLVNAEAVRERLIAEGYRPEKITVIKNGLDPTRFAKTNGDATLRREFGLAPRAPLVAVVSRLNQLKGVEYFLEAAGMVAQHFPEARFVIVGDDPYNQNGLYKRSLHERAARLGLDSRLIFTGLRQDIPGVLSEVAVSVLPSLSEGLSNVLLESMAAGVPVVATRVGGNPEVVQDGATGFLTPPRDAAALARGIGLLLADPELASRFGRAAKQRIADHFSFERMVEKTEHLYLDLLKKASPRRLPVDALRAEGVPRKEHLAASQGLTCEPF